MILNDEDFSIELTQKNRETCQSTVYLFATKEKKNGFCTVYPSGAVQDTIVYYGAKEGTDPSRVVVRYQNGERFEWMAQNVDSYTAQFGLSVSGDGKLLFVQTWESGLYAYEAKSGKEVWHFSCEKGITALYLHEDSLLCHERDRTLYLLDMTSGKILNQKSPARSWQFYILKENYILCQTTPENWEIIRTDTLESVETIPVSKFGKYFGVKKVVLKKDKLCYDEVSGGWDLSVKPPVMRPVVVTPREYKVHCFEG